MGCRYRAARRSPAVRSRPMCRAIRPATAGAGRRGQQGSRLVRNLHASCGQHQIAVARRRQERRQHDRHQRLRRHIVHRCRRRRVLQYPDRRHHAQQWRRHDGVAAIRSTTPSMDGVAAAGSGTSWARADHVHPTDTSRYAATNPERVSNPGAGAGRDHNQRQRGCRADRRVRHGGADHATLALATTVRCRRTSRRSR